MNLENSTCLNLSIFVRSPYPFKSDNEYMKQSWFNTVIPIATLFSFRMLGLFMLIPVFTIYATHLSDSSPTLIGIALGSYGLSQGLLQIPFGMLSDRFGRKPIITIGLILFALGSLVGALSTSIYGMIIARTLQGTGAIGSVLIALLADLTPDEQRTKGMAVIGITIGLSFSLAMVLSPAITQTLGLSSIFYLTTVLALLGLILLHTVIATPKKEPFHLDSEAKPALFKQVLLNKALQRLNAGIFCQHFILTATFYAIPRLLQQQIKLGHIHQQWHFYLPLVVLSFILMLPLVGLSERQGKIKSIFLACVATTGICQLGLAFSHNHWLGICSFMFSYFVAFNFLEASLPSLISKQASPETKGTAMGIYSSSQFLGIFAGGVIAGLLDQYIGNTGIFVTNGLLSLLWFLLSYSMQPSLYQVTLILPYEPSQHNISNLHQRLSQLTGIVDLVISEEESTIYLRVIKNQYEKGSAEKMISTNNRAC